MNNLTNLTLPSVFMTTGSHVAYFFKTPSDKQPYGVTDHNAMTENKQEEWFMANEEVLLRLSNTIRAIAETLTKDFLERDQA